MQAKFGPLAIGLTLCLMVGVSPANSAVQWQPTFERAQVAAAHSNRLVLLHFWGNGCPPCAWMDQEVFTRPDVGQAIDRGFVAVKVNKDQFPALAAQFGVAAVPTDVVMTPQGQVLGSYVGRTPAPEFINRLNQIAQQFGPPPGQNETWGPPNQAMAAAPNYSLPVSQPQPNPGYPAPGVGPGIGQPQAYPQQPYADQARAAQVSPRYSDQYDEGMNNSRMPASPPVAPLGPEGPYIPDRYPSDPPMPPTMQQAATPPQPSANPDIVPRDGNPPLALDGFCAVSLERTMRLDPQPRWILGDVRWGARHEGRTYLFAGPEEQQVFLQNPNFYAPVLSGNDAVLYVEFGQQVPGLREFGARWRDRVYLFSSRENYEKFRANPGFYENEVVQSRQAVAGTPQLPPPHGGAAMNPHYGFR